MPQGTGGRETLLELLIDPPIYVVSIVTYLSGGHPDDADLCLASREA